MKDIKLVREQMVHLVNNIKECNFISYTDKDDIVQHSIEQIYKKYTEGKIGEEFEEIKNYTFITLRNYCVQFKNKKKPIYTDNNFSHIADDNIYDDTEYKEELKNIARSYFNTKKMDDSLIQITELIFEDRNNEEIQDMLGLTAWELGRKKQRLTLVLKNAMKRTNKYVIKDINNPNYRVICHTAYDVINQFPNETQRNVREKIYNKKHFKDGRYIEKIDNIKKDA